jgi:Fe-S cluster biosynthesis and repair protein YggX
MSMVHCAKCGQEREGLAGPPFGGELGEKVLAQVCKPCWGEWIGRQTMMINEYRMNVVDPKAQELLLTEMKSFLSLRA